MERLIVEGGHRLSGVVGIHGAKNSALPILAATILSDGVSVIENCPGLSDVTATTNILRHLGCTVTAEGGALTVDPGGGIRRSVIPEDMMREMRSSIIFMGPLLAKTGAAEMAFPGGCDLGPRPIDYHLDAFRRMGAVIHEKNGLYICHTNGRLRGTDITLPAPSVGATENILLAAVTAEGNTVLRNCAMEPEVGDLITYLNRCGGRVRRTLEGNIVIEGVSELHGACHAIIPDRIEAATYMAAAAVTGGSMVLKGVHAEHMAPVLPAFEETGCHISFWKDEMLISAPLRLHRPKTIFTSAYPGFPTDAAAPLMAMACLAEGTTVFIENIFQNRYHHAVELTKMGARIKIEGKVAIVEGVSGLSGARISCTDLRGGAALVVAALAACGPSEIYDLRHLDRGYQQFDECLNAVGAVIRRTDDTV